MIAVARNIINEIKQLDKDVFSRDELIKIIKDVSGVSYWPVIESNGVELNPEKFNMTFNGTVKVLPRKEFALLYYLISNKNKCISRYNILRDIWGTNIIVHHRTIDVHVRKLRAKTDPNFIRTDKGMGYIWIEE